MTKLKDQIEKLEKDIKALVANQKSQKKEMKNSNATIKKEIKEEVVLVLERRLDDKLDIMNEKQKELNDKMSAMTKNISTSTKLEHHDTEPEYHSENVTKTKVWYEPYQ